MLRPGGSGCDQWPAVTEPGWWKRAWQETVGIPRPCR